jgi:DNA-binding CsgD family transcriptional regulator
VLDRVAEMSAIGAMLSATRDGDSSALVLRGEPGVGLTTLLRGAVEQAAGMRILRAVGADSESDLPFGGVHQLCLPMLGGLGALPPPQSDALSVAFGIRSGAAPERFLVGLGVLELLTAWSAEMPVLCMVDDAQWMDPSSAVVLGFVARRLTGQRVGLLIAVQSAVTMRGPLSGIPELAIEGLPHDAARRLLAAQVDGQLAPAVADRLIDETGGNGRALLELAGELRPEQLSGAADIPDLLPIGEAFQRYFVDRLRRQPAPTRLALLVAAAEPAADRTVFFEALEELGIPPSATAPAQAQGLLRVGPSVSLRSAMLRSALYNSAPESDLQRVHLALAEVAAGRHRRGRRAWHVAATLREPAEPLAVDLAAAGHRAFLRGDYVWAARYGERAAQLSPDSADRASRLLDAAVAHLAGGAPQRAASLLAEATLDLGVGLGLARAAAIRGAISFSLGEGALSAAMLTEAARGLEPLDARLARTTHLEAVRAAIYAGGFGAAGDLRPTAMAAQAAPRATGVFGPADHLLDGFAALLVSGHTAAAPDFREALAGLKDESDPRWFSLASMAALELRDDDALHALATRQAALSDMRVSSQGLMFSVDQLIAMDETIGGHFAAANRRLVAAYARAEAMADPTAMLEFASALLTLAAWRGDEDSVRRQAAVVRREATMRGLGHYATVTLFAACVLDVALGRYEDAVINGQAACAYDSVYVRTVTLPELVEAAVRSGDRAAADEALGRLEGQAGPGDTNWARGMLARSRALVAPGGQAEELYREAIACLGRCRAVPHLARAHLLYGEWLRRERHRRAARQQLRRAYDLFSLIGAEAFARRARAELNASGEQLPARGPEASQRLTAQETQIARLVVEGKSNSEIAAQLYISPRTVEYHLHKVFRKLEIGSRTQLVHALPRQED